MQPNKQRIEQHIAKVVAQYCRKKDFTDVVPKGTKVSFEITEALAKRLFQTTIKNMTVVGSTTINTTLSSLGLPGGLHGGVVKYVVDLPDYVAAYVTPHHGDDLEPITGFCEKILD